MSDGPIEENPEFIEYADRVLSELVPKMQASGMVVSLVPSGPSDVKYAIELGFSIMLDKPIIAVFEPGTKLPDKLVKVADHLVEADMSSPAGMRALQKKLTEITGALDG